MTLFPQNQMDPQVQEAIQMIVKLRSSEQFCWQYYLNVTADTTVKASQLRVGGKVVRLAAFMTLRVRRECLHHWNVTETTSQWAWKEW